MAPISCYTAILKMKSLKFFMMIYKYIDKYITKNEQENYGNDNNSGKKAKSKYKNSL